MQKHPAESLEEGKCIPGSRRRDFYSFSAIMEQQSTSTSVWDARPSHKQVNTPPVVVELPVTEAQQLGREVHG